MATSLSPLSAPSTADARVRRMAFSQTRVLWCMLALAGVSPPDATAQQPPPRRAAADATAVALGRGWTALGSGAADSAIKAADEVLVRQPAHHGALELKIEAMEGRPIPALDVYEAWLLRFRLEDPFLLAPIARGTLAQVASGPDAALRAEALDRLARSGEADAEAQLRALPPVAISAIDVERALEGNAAAATRLLDPGHAATVPPATLARALAAAGPP